jgi:hypothetical protein
MQSEHSSASSLPPEEQPASATRFGGRHAENLAFPGQQVSGSYQKPTDNEADGRHFEGTELIVQITGHICGLAALLILAAVSWHAIDRGAYTQAASIICTGAVSIVTVFVTGKMTSRQYGMSRPVSIDRDEHRSHHCR